ncbi:MAG: DNA cytosine methyltransferase [Bacteroidales bacterium]|nr:DNA cytosine methyltransferase [Bacteroidales bacterium]
MAQRYGVKEVGIMSFYPNDNFFCGVQRPPSIPYSSVPLPAARRAREYNADDALSIFRFSGKLLHPTLAEIVPMLDDTISEDDLSQDGKGGLGVLVEKYFFGYDPNSNPEADFLDAGVELKVSPLKKLKDGVLGIKERLVCDMIDYMAIVDEEFEQSRFFKKSVLLLIIFYLHLAGVERKDLRFMFSVLWQIKGKDLLIIKDDKYFHVRPKAGTSKDKHFSPATGEAVPRKAYWFNNSYVLKEVNPMCDLLVGGFPCQDYSVATTLPDPLDRPSRTIITGEGGAGPSRFKHVVLTPSGRYRRLIPKELERLNMFPDDHTTGASDMRRAFLMGNALVTGIVERIGTILAQNI